MDRQELLNSIHLGMIPDKEFYLKIYGHDLSHPGFRDFALNRLNQIGVKNPWGDYAEIVTEFEECRDAMYAKIAEEENRDAEYAKVG